MAKHSRPADPPIEAQVSPGTGGKERQRLKGLERELADLRATEAKRLKQLTEVRASAVEVRAELTALRAKVAAQTPGSGAAAGPIGYCMREKRPVEISDPQPVTLSNGRAAIAGSCSICGSRVMVLSARPVQSNA